MTACECFQPGWCERHLCYKTERRHMLCRTRNDYFRLWEEGNGPGQNLELQGNPAVEFPCIQLGERLREQECPTCNGSVLLKVFTCELHGECTLAKTIKDIACCTTCKDYERCPTQATHVTD